MTQTQTVPSEKRSYRSPQRILVRFFKKSRDQWKAKCFDAKATLRHVKNRAKWLEQSRDQWKNRAQELARRVKELEAQAADQPPPRAQASATRRSEQGGEGVKKSRISRSPSRTP